MKRIFAIACCATSIIISAFVSHFELTILGTAWTLARATDDIWSQPTNQSLVSKQLRCSY